MLLLWILGCFSEVEEATFPEYFAEEQCVLYKRCYRAKFDGEFETMGNCVEKLARDISDDAKELYEGCTFQAEKAQECLNEFGSATCAQYWDEYNAAAGDLYTLCHEETWTCE